MRAICLVRNHPNYGQEHFVAGLTKLGYQVIYKMVDNPEPDDVLLIWNRYGPNHTFAAKFEEAGAPVIVAENAYLPIRGSSQSYALSLNRHNGGGRWPKPDHSRFETLDITLKPWKTDGDVILLLPQRGIGVPPIAMPRTWPSVTERSLKRITRYLVKVRPHPGKVQRTTLHKRQLTLEEDLQKAWCAVTWGSGAAAKALVAGVPVFYELKCWMAGPAAHRGYEVVRNLKPGEAHTLMGDREAMLERLSWAQWSAKELETGEPIRRLVELHNKS